MYRFIVIFMLMSCMVVSLHAQPPESWFRTYDYDLRDRFNDVYALQDGGYVVCGETRPSSNLRSRQASMLIVKVDDNGEEIWSSFYDVENNWEEGNSIIEADNGDLVVGGSRKIDNGEYHCTAWRVSSEGEEIWSNTYGLDWCYAVIELKSGEFLLAGRAQRSALLVLIDTDGEELWQREYSIERCNGFTSMRETDGGVIVVGYTYPRPAHNDNSQIWTLKIDPEREGEIIWSRTYDFRPNQRGYSIVSAPNNGFLIAGVIDNQLEENDLIDYRSWWLLLRINGDGNVEWSREYEMENVRFCGKCVCLERLRFDDNNIIAAGGGGDGGPNEGKLLHISGNGQENWRRIYDVIDEFDVYRFRSVVEGRDGSIVVAGYGRSDDESEVNGCLLKFAPIVNEPEFLRWSPQDTMQTLLLGDSLQFILVAQDQQQDTLSYLWIMGEDTLTRDTTVTITFEEMGLFDVQCQVSDGNSTVAITWHVSVVEFYISGFNPEDLEFVVRRQSEVNFDVNIRAIDGIDTSYLWTLIHRNNQREEIGDADEISVLFDESGQHRLQVQVSNENESDEVTWAINVRSAIWSWWPSELEIAAYVDSTYEFVITPFNEESDSLEFFWMVNDELLESDSASVHVTFLETGQCEITSIVNDGIEVDTIRWTVNVEEWSFTADDADFADLPSSSVLYPASPNPFNSLVKLSMYLPRADHVSLSVFDVSGREVSKLVDGNVRAGSQSYIWNANCFPAGVYVVRMDVGDVTVMRKVVLVR